MALCRNCSTNRIDLIPLAHHRDSLLWLTTYCGSTDQQQETVFNRLNGQKNEAAAGKGLTPTTHSTESQQWSSFRDRPTGFSETKIQKKQAATVSWMEQHAAGITGS